MFTITPLSSGSQGNATLIQSADDAVLVDCGLSGKALLKALDAIELDRAKLRAILITHEHSDHVVGLARCAELLRIPVYANMETAAVIRYKIAPELAITTFENGQRFHAGQLRVESLSIPHDSANACAFIVEHAGRRVAVATDFGYPAQSVLTRLQGCHAVLLEANYDQKMLEASDRPWRLKQRIMARTGHLSNTDSLLMLEGLVGHGLHTIIAGHISDESNDYALVEDLFRAKLESLKASHINLHIARQREAFSSALPI